MAEDHTKPSNSQGEHVETMNMPREEPERDKESDTAEPVKNQELPTNPSNSERKHDHLFSSNERGVDMKEHDEADEVEKGEGSESDSDSDNPLGTCCSSCALVRSTNESLLELVADPLQMIYGTGHACLSCVDFSLCSKCMNDLSVFHEPHNFLAYDDATAGRIRIRISDPAPPSTKEVESPPTKGTEDDSKIYLVKTLYTYDYRNQANDQVAFIESEKRRVPTVPKRKGIQVSPKENGIPIVTRKVTIETDLKTGTKLTKSDLDSYDTEEGEVEIDISSPMILNAVRAVVNYYPGWGLWDGSFRSLSVGQLHILFHHRLSLLEYKAHHPPCHTSEYISECNQHIDELVGFLDQEFKDILAIHNRWTKAELTVSFDELRRLFVVGQLMYWRGNDQLDPYICSHWKAPSDKFLVEGWNIDFDGSTFGRAKRAFEIETFVGRTKITALPVFPARFYDEKESETSFRERRIESGKKFCKVSRKPSYMEYTGVTRDVPSEKV